MKRSYKLLGLSLLTFFTAGFVFAQNIELPDVTTVISGETVKAGADALPDFSDVLVVSGKSGSVVPQLPDVDAPSSEVDNTENTKTDKSIFAEGLIGGGYPTLFKGDFSVFRLTGDDPFKIAFYHDSAIGYGNHDLTDCFSDRSTSLILEKTFTKNQFEWNFNGAYNAVSNGLQNQVPGISNLNQDNYSAFGNFNWNMGNGFSSGVNLDLNFYNRYADVVTGSFGTALAASLNPELYLKWSANGFEAGLTGDYWCETDLNDVISSESAHRGLFGGNFAWSNQIVKAYANAAIAFGNQFGESSITPPFAAGLELNIPVYFSNRRFSINAEGGLDSQMNKISELERKYKFAVLSVIPTETADWYGKINFSVPVKESFTGNFGLEYRQTAFDKGHWQPDYSVASKGIFTYENVSMTQFISDVSLTYHYNIFSISGGWHSNWIDVPVLEAPHEITVDLNFQSEDSKWGLDLNGAYDLSSETFDPVINFEGFIRLTSAVRAVVSVEDILKLFTAQPRVYAGEYITRGGTATLLLKFFF